jgi:hypothetical protein
LEKVKLQKEVAEALEFAKSKVSKEDIVRWHVDHIWTDDEKPLQSLSLDHLITALYVGYELEVSPEEKVKEYFLNHLKLEDQVYHNGVLNGILKTLELLNIKLKGVNS